MSEANWGEVLSQTKPLQGIYAMDSGEVYAKISQMREVASTLARSSARVNECLESVEREVNALGADRFMSVGAEAFRGEFNRLTPKLRDASDLLLRFQDKLNTAADDIEIAARTGGTST